MLAEAQVAVGVSLELGCVSARCDSFSQPLHDQMTNGTFDNIAGMPLMSGDEWDAEHRTGRKRVYRAERHGYRFDTVNREEWTDDLYAINTSAEVRQGRRMSESYTRRYQYSALPVYECERHQVRTYGVTAEAGHLVAYLWLYVCGQLRLCSSIIGHADHLDDGIMYLMFRGMLDAEHSRDPDGLVMYHRWDNGTDGLRFYKQHVGLRDTAVRWLP